MEEGGGSGTCGGFMPAYSCMDGGSGGNFWGINRAALLYFAKIARTPYMTGEGPVTETLTIAKTRFSTFNFRAQITDSNAHNAGQTINAAELYVDVPPWRGGTPVPMTAEDGNFNSTTEYAICIGIHLSTGRHIIFVRGRDAAGNWGAVKAVFKNDPAVLIDPRPY
jgi:hypothetical protein